MYRSLKTIMNNQFHQIWNIFGKFTCLDEEKSKQKYLRVIVRVYQRHKHYVGCCFILSPSASFTYPIRIFINDREIENFKLNYGIQIELAISEWTHWQKANKNHNWKSEFARLHLFNEQIQTCVLKFKLLMKAHD